MKRFKDGITFVKNSRGCFILDTTKGCSGCNNARPRGCYDNCYAQAIALRYGRGFQEVIERKFKPDTMQGYLFDMAAWKHEREILMAIKRSGASFIRIGEMGDPSDAWGNTVSICEIIARSGKPIVLITKHWKEASDNTLAFLSACGVAINTSISALDTDTEIEWRLNQYSRVKEYMRSVLRIVTCLFNLSTKEGRERNAIQEYLLTLPNVLETAFRPSHDNPLFRMGIIEANRERFLGATCLVSKRVDGIYLGGCQACPDQCGLAGGYV